MRIFKTVLYLAIIGAALAIAWQRIADAWTLLLSSACHVPHADYWPLWLLLSLGLFGYAIALVIVALLRRRLGLWHHAAVLILFSAVLLGRLVGPFWEPPREQAWQDLADAPPHWLMARAASRLDRALSERDRVPADQAALEALMAEGDQAPPSGYVGHGFSLPVRLVRLADSSGPITTVRPGDRAGTLYLAVSPAADQYWITAVGLSAYPRGEARIMADPTGAPLVLSGPAGRDEGSRVR